MDRREKRKFVQERDWKKERRLTHILSMEDDGLIKLSEDRLRKSSTWVTQRALHKQRKRNWA